MQAEHLKRRPSRRFSPTPTGDGGEPIPLPSTVVTCSSCKSTTCHCIHPDASATERRYHAKAKLSKLWMDFNRALRSVEPFDQMHWMRALFVATVQYLYHVSRLSVAVQTSRLDTIWRPLVPAFGIGLVVFVEVIYFAKLRYHFVVRSWCEPCNDNTTSKGIASHNDGAGYGEATCTTTDGETTYCVWDIAHCCFAIYLGIMITFHYVYTTFASPGVVLPVVKNSGETDTSSTAQNVSRVEEKWSCIDARGGCCFIDPVLDVAYERRLVSMYPSTSVDADESSENVNGSADAADADADADVDADAGTAAEVRYYPSPFPSFCTKCQIERPARAHHCSACNRCVLQMDHHCPWVNNCIGYGNYRSFFLSIFFITIGTLYGMFLLGPPFYGAMKSQFQEHGFKLLLKHKTGLLDLPPPWVLWRQARTTGIEPDVLLRMVASLLIGAGLAMAGFLVYHVVYVAKGLTTLEHSIILSMMKKELDERPANVGKITRPINPFDRGWRRNFAQILGPSFLALILPIPVEPRAPFAPKRKDD